MRISKKTTSNDSVSPNPTECCFGQLNCQGVPLNGILEEACHEGRTGIPMMSGIYLHTCARYQVERAAPGASLVVFKLQFIASLGSLRFSKAYSISEQLRHKWLIVILTHRESKFGLTHSINHDTPPDLDRRIFEVPDKVLADDVSAVWIFQKSIPKPQRRTLPDALRHMRP
jgi:hypothetical protein